MRIEPRASSAGRKAKSAGLLFTLLLAACGTREPPDDAAFPAATEPEAITSPSGPATTTLLPDPAVPDVAPCPGLAAEVGATITTAVLTEASGLVVSQNHDGVFWTHNDDGRSPTVIAIDLAGNELGRFPLPGISGIDIEDLALVDGILYLADIGDNQSRRDGIAVYRFTEPDPGGSTGIEAVDVIRLRYPGRSFDAESLVVDPLSGELIIIVKAVKIGLGRDSAPLSAAVAPVFVADPPFDLDGVTELEQRGVVALDQLATLASGEAPEGSIRDLGLADVATGADIRSDGATIAVRTYRTVWLFDRQAGDSVAGALGGSPCEAPTIFEPQGEAVGFLGASSNAFATVSEGLNQSINVTR